MERLLGLVNGLYSRLANDLEENLLLSGEDESGCMECNILRYCSPVVTPGKHASQYVITTRRLAFYRAPAADHACLISMHVKARRQSDQAHIEGTGLYSFLFFELLFLGSTSLSL